MTRIGVVMDPIRAIDYDKDTTMAMLWAASERGWSLHYMEPGDLYQEGGTPMATARALQVFRDRQRWYQLGEATTLALGELDVILMRRDPPVDSEFIYNTYLLEAAERLGTLVVNPPQALRDHNEKLFATRFPQCTPPLLVTSQAELLREFHREHGDVIFKPLDGMGGSSIFRVQPEDPNLSVIIETLTRHGERTIMAQRYLPAIAEGDKRILLVDGEPVPWCLARIPARGETRGNIAAGGIGRTRPLSDRDRWIAEQVAPTVREQGLLFVGLDVIGDYLTEINITSPTCVREIDDGCGTRIADQLLDVIADQLAARP